MSSSFLPDLEKQMERTLNRATGACVKVELVGKSGYTISGTPVGAQLVAEWIQSRGLMRIENQTDDEHQRTYTMIG